MLLDVGKRGREQGSDGRRASAVAFALCDAACRQRDSKVHPGAEDDMVASLGQRLFNRDRPVRVDDGVHEQVDWGDAAPLVPERGIDVLQA